MKMRVYSVVIFIVLSCWTFDRVGCDAGKESAEGLKNIASVKTESGDDGGSGQVDDGVEVPKNNSRSSVVAGVQRRLTIGGAPRRDTQLLSLLAARRRQLLTERLGAHLATIATFASKPDRHNITNAHLEIRDANNTVIKRISLPDNKSLSSGEIRLDREHSSKVPFRIDSIAKPTTQAPDSRSTEVKSSLNAKAIQDAKVIRAGFLNNRRKQASEVIRYGAATRKPLFDFSAVSHETLGIPEYKKEADDKTDVLLDPEEEFQVDESNHGIILFNYSNNDTTAFKSNDTNQSPKRDIEIINATLTTRSSFPEDPTKITKEVKLHAKINLDIQNATVNSTKLDNKTKTDVLLEPTAKTTKIDASLNKDNENNTLFLTDELYNHFRPLESELPVEDMAPFLFFGQKITLSIPRDNITHLQLTPTKPTHYIRQHDKKQRGSYRPVTEKITNTSEENEEEVNENMDVSVVKNVIEKNKIRNTAKMQAPSRHGNLVNAYRKLQILNSTTPTPPFIMPNNQTLIEVIDESKEKRLAESSNRTVGINHTRSINRTFNYRRKPAKLIQLINETAETTTTTTTTTTTSAPSTVVYTAVVTSVSVTSSVKALNKTDAKNNTNISLTDDIAIKLNDTAQSLKNATNIEESVNGTVENASSTTIEPIEKKNNTTVNKFKKKPESRHRLSTIRPRIRFTTHVKSHSENLNAASPTPFILYSNRSSPRILQTTTKYKFAPTTEKIVATTQKILHPTQYKSQNITASPFNATENTKISTSATTKRYKLSEPSDTNIFKINSTTSRFAVAFNNTNKNNSYFYANDTSATPTTTTTTTATAVRVNVQESSTVRSRNKDNDSNEYDEKLTKEILERRNNEVLIEMEKTNLTTYVLAGLGFLPITIIVMFVLRHIFMKKTKDIDTDYEGYFQDSEMKKESQITTVARPPLPPPNKPDQKWEFPRNKLRLQTLLGQGNFGQVWKAEADDLTGHDGLTRLVAVKTIKETATQKEKQELLQEIYIMQKIGNHTNVVTLLACCTEQEPYLLIMEYVMCGKLLTYLRDRRSRVDRFQMPRGGLTSRDLTVFAYCVARGMDYLASKGIIHRDLAARNVLVDHNKLCKIADFGMSREVTSTTDDKASKPQRNALPVRWMAPEALLYSVYSHESDVWAYGVLLWEIVTLGSTPYATMSGREVLHMVTEGYRLERPAHCKPHLYDTMHSCWHADPAQRPPFSEIKRKLSELLENEPTEGNYVDLESFYQDSSVYSDPSAIIENDGGISIEYSDELGSKLRDEEPRRSFHIPNASNLQRNRSNYRNENFNTVRAGNHTTVGGFGIMDGGFSGRDGNFCERGMDKLSGSSFHRERENNISRENGHPGNSLISRNSFNGVGNQNNWSGHGGRPFINKSGSSRSKRISEFECNI